MELGHSMGLNCFSNGDRLCLNVSGPERHRVPIQLLDFPKICISRLNMSYQDRKAVTIQGRLLKMCLPNQEFFSLQNMKKAADRPTVFHNPLCANHLCSGGFPGNL